MKQRFKTREEVVEHLLRPIKWSWSSSIEYRKAVITARYDSIKLVYHFLTKEEKRRFDKWDKDNNNRELWD